MIWDTVGSVQVQKFAEAIYKRLVEIEDKILRGNKGLPGVCGLRMFARVDTALMWDDRDANVGNHKYRLVLNEVQPGDASMFMIDADCRNTILWAFVEGLKRGGLHQDQ